jgi:chromosome segregation ATPase
MNADNAQGARESNAEIDRLTRERDDLAARLAIREAAFTALEQNGTKLRGELEAAKKSKDELLAKVEAGNARSEALQAELAASKNELAGLRSAGKQAQALHKETQARLKAVVATERDRASRLELYVESLLSENAASRDEAKRQREAAAEQLADARKPVAELEKRIAELEQTLERTIRKAAHERDDVAARLKATEARCRDLQIAGDGYLARIEALKAQGKVSG